MWSHCKVVRISGELSIGILRILVLAGILSCPSAASRAEVALTRADIAATVNRVELLPRGQAPRPAQLTDHLGQGDSLRTAGSSQAELRFNDGSLARIGEYATFSFVPNTRSFHLSQGTFLLLIPSGLGRSTIQTPNVVAGVQGTALIARHIDSRDLSLIMALTNHPAGPVAITLPDGSQEASLYAGQMALVQDNRVQIVEFDLEAFYQTSTLVQGLHLDNIYEADDNDPIATVRRETTAALHEQPEFASSGSFLNPNLIQIDALNPDTELEEAAVPPAPSEANPLSGRVSSEIPPQVVNPPVISGPENGNALEGPATEPNPAPVETLPTESIPSGTAEFSDTTDTIPPAGIPAE